MHGSHGKGHETHDHTEKTFKEQTEDNEQYRKGYIEGLEQACKGKHKTENSNAR
ncbi:hypothetical protein GLIP_4235 [Aliiglaciecola lipolytica E3]|uniref:Uncharacterized protein n=2 Tax=Aliiglaciecola TaxID=1406885 RepID=K6XYZ0_9ALTE|nr:hypothetical protein GLIP_4235 [Aliiglaciecola lipolytica E3]